VNSLPDLIPRRVSLVVADAPARPLLPGLIARLALRGPLRVLDAGNCFPAYPVARDIRRSTPDLEAALKRIQIARAFTCYQVLALLEDTPDEATPVLILELLSTFADENIKLEERQRLLACCTQEIQRIRRQAPVGIVVSVRPQPDMPVLLKTLENAADTVLRFEAEQPLPLPRLF
jgi:hypothetical protein